MLKICICNNELFIQKNYEKISCWNHRCNKCHSLFILNNNKIIDYLFQLNHNNINYAVSSYWLEEIKLTNFYKINQENVIPILKIKKFLELDITNLKLSCENIFNRLLILSNFK